jgi:copper oxidase (laccase) domain-containing protein
MYYDPKSEKLTHQLQEVTQHALQLGAERVLWQRFANDRTPEDRFKVAYFHSALYTSSRGNLRNERCDGIVLYKEGDAVAVTTRDCPVLTLFSEDGGPVLVLHCSRTSLQDFDTASPVGQSIIRNALATQPQMLRHPEKVRGFITMGIAARHFHNDRYPMVIEGIHKMWGSGVVGESESGPTIDLLALIHAQLSVFGIRPEQIEHDGLDTFTDERLGSVRAGREGHNLTIVSYLQKN